MFVVVVLGCSDDVDILGVVGIVCMLGGYCMHHVSHTDTKTHPHTSTHIHTHSIFVIHTCMYMYLLLIHQAGKALASRMAEIRVQFRHVPGNLYHNKLGLDLDRATNELV